MDVDCVSDGEDILIPGIMEHVESTGIHSGDSITSYPPYSLPEEVIEELVSDTARIAKALHIVGLVNIQYAWDGNKVYVIEVNPRASRTVPILSKATDVPLVKLAVQVMTGKKLKDPDKTEQAVYIIRKYSELGFKVYAPKAINKPGADTFPIRRAAIEHDIPVMTSLDTAWLFTIAVELEQRGEGKSLAYEAL